MGDSEDRECLHQHYTAVQTQSEDPAVGGRERRLVSAALDTLSSLAVYTHRYRYTAKHTEIWTNKQTQLETTATTTKTTTTTTFGPSPRQMSCHVC